MHVELGARVIQGPGLYFRIRSLLSMRKVILNMMLMSGFCLGAQTTLAQCTCVPQLTLRGHFERADAIFVGRVVRARKLVQTPTDGYDMFVTFEVKQTWRQ